ncbi:MAG: acyl-CoA thioesterase [Thermodesulfobacteriota bacterium]|nr:acyl-CoA thioesterase [Thermodesulfobacteriota bacterium]
MEGKKVSESSVILAQQMNPQDANPAGNVHGGVIIKLIDTIAGAVATKHARANTVTASIDRLDFHNPVYLGNLLMLKASLDMVGRTSMEIGVRVESEDLITGKIRHTASAYLTFVALDKKGKSMLLPPLILETREQKRRNREAMARKKTRLFEKKKEKECQDNSKNRT